MSLATPPATPWPLRTLLLEERRIKTKSSPLRALLRMSCSEVLAKVQRDSSCKWLSSEQKESIEYAASGYPHGTGGTCAVFLVPAVREAAERAVRVIVTLFVALTHGGT
jgi:hypothetical protein